MANEIGPNNTVRFKIKSSDAVFRGKQLKPMTSLVGGVYEPKKAKNDFHINNTQDREILAQAHQALPVTESQTAREIDLITKPSDM